MVRSGRMPARLLPVAVTALLLLFPAAAHGSFPGSNGRIAFNWTFGCDGSMIATMRPDGSDRRRLTANACVVEGGPRATFPDWSADGRRIAFLRNGRLMTMTAGGANETPVPLLAPNVAGRPTLSPDGERIAYTRVSGGRQWIYRANLDGTGETRLRVGSNPRWSPGGRNMAFITPTGRIATMRAISGHIFHRHRNVRAESMDWRPDGHRVVFASRGGDLFLIRAKHDAVPRRLLDTGAREAHPMWSPDGERIAFVRRLRAGEEEVRYGIFTMPVRGGTPRRIFRTSEERVEETLEPLTIAWRAR
jgi:dipeptidyl aminopeptidase/acylaminoacyl peptidase